MSLVFVCWHSRKWWPPIRGGQLQLALLQLEKAKWTDFFCKKGISYTYFWWKSKKRDEKLTKTLKKSCFFEPLRPSGWVWPDLVQTISGRPDLVQTKSGELSQMVRGAEKKQLFFRVLVSFSSCFLHFHQKYVYEMPFLQKKIGPFGLL